MLFSSQLQYFVQMLPWINTRQRQAELRAIIERKRRIYDAARASSDSTTIISHIEQLEIFRTAKVVLLYYPIRNEVDLRPLVDKYQSEKLFLLPVIHRDHMDICPYHKGDTLKLGHARVPEPQSSPYRGKIDLILTPGVVFDKQKHRIGRGGGYYDRFLRRYRHAFALGVGYDFQLLDNTIPHTSRDKTLDGVVTPQHTIV